MFVGTSALTQVGALASVAGRSFFVDYTTHTMYLGVDPTSRPVDASYLQTAISFVNAPGSALLGIGIDEYATPLGSFSPLQVMSPNVLVENVISSHNAAPGVTVQAPNVVLRNDTFTDNAQLGVHAFQADGLVVDRVKIVRNNVEQLDPTTEAGGLKVTSTTGVTIQTSVSDANLGNGIWLDVGVTNARVVRNVVRRNTSNGISFEISSGAVIAANLTWGNAAAGVLVNESSMVDVWNNTAADNGQDIAAVDGTRRQALGPVVLRNNAMYAGAGGSRVLVAVADYSRQRSAAQMGVTADGDAYCRANPNSPPTAAQWAAVPSTLSFHTLAQLAQSTGQESSGIACDGNLSTSVFVNAAGNNYHLVSGSPLAGRGTPLNANVAGALGLPGTTAVNIGAF